MAYPRLVPRMIRSNGLVHSSRDCPAETIATLEERAQGDAACGLGLRRYPFRWEMDSILGLAVVIWSSVGHCGG